ncbi:hypothetical protein OC842_003446 [Tilletia horrida]|uniref:Uncharacterized protein n=1 Tax=Tilletia horrida TaxID=155126 RepID=A0AAN6JK62_9BASI|nr:hypothetical protein OC842_003446 [Tilletia horrida]
MQLSTIALLSMIPTALCVSAWPQESAPSRALYVARALQDFDQIDGDIVILRRALDPRSGRSGHKDLKEANDHTQAALDLINKHGGADKVPPAEMEKVMGHIHASKSSMSKFASASNLDHVGKVSALDKNAPPHRDGKKSSGGRPGTSGRD